MSSAHDPADVSGQSFAALGLPDPLLQSLTKVGYESPSPIQEATIPVLLAGRDLLGQAQTGTGKTAAFALPILARLDLARSAPQALVLTPTRELAIQVAEAFQTYASELPGFHVLPIYGGQAYGPQLGGLRRGVHVVVGTPGRVIDHLRRGTLDLKQLDWLVLDEADEMLRMGFIDDVETILKESRPGRQIALFSATMPAQIRRIAKSHLNDPAEITIRNKTTTAANTRQRYWMVSGMHKLDALTRILEVEPFDAMIIFARTKVATEELTERLAARGFAAAALNGDLVQAQRERTVGRLRSGDLDILVATDVAARGLDVERISHVVNFDIPHDTEAYVHRIGRTGRAGRKGEAILFVSPREQRMLHAIERATRQPIEPMQLPSVADVNDQRIVRFKEKITAALAREDLGGYRDVVGQYEREQGVDALDIAAALAALAQGDTPLLIPAPPPRARREDETRPATKPPREERPHRPREARTPMTVNDAAPPPPRPPHRDRKPESGRVLYRLAVGHVHGVKPGNIVGAIANEAGLDSQHIGRVEILEDHTLVDLPDGMPKEILRHLKKVWVAGQQLRMIAAGDWQAGTDKVDAPKSKASKPERDGDSTRRPKAHRKGGAGRQG